MPDGFNFIEVNRQNRKNGHHSNDTNGDHQVHTTTESDVLFLSGDVSININHLGIIKSPHLLSKTNPTPPKPNTQPTSTEAPKAEPKDALADSVTVRAGIVAVRQWMAEGKAKGKA